MRYFIVTVDEHYKAPMPIGWYGKLDRKVWKGKKAYDMPRNLFFYVDRHMQMVFTDIITYPCFMVSRMVKMCWYSMILSYSLPGWFCMIKSRKAAWHIIYPFWRMPK